MDLKIKICGMRNPENIQEVAALHPDYMGFIFYETSPRFVGNKYTIPTLEPSIKCVGVFVNETEEGILKTIARTGIAVVQLHGAESPELCYSLKSKGIEVIKAFSIDASFDFSITTSYEHAVDFLLFDTKGKYYGGNSKTFNWSILKKYNQKTPFFLSGGLSPENILDIKQLAGMNLYALDVNSGVEIAPALKSIDKIKQLYQKVINV